MQSRNQGDQITGRFLESQVLAGCGGLVVADFGEHDTVTELVGEHVEVEAEGLRFALLARPESEFDEAVSRLRVVPVEDRDEFEALEVVAKLPLDASPEVALPNIEHAAHAAVHVRGYELAGTDVQMIEMAIRIRLNRWVCGPTIRGEIGELVRLLLSNGIDDVHTIVGWSRHDSARGRRQPHGLRLPEMRQVVGLGEQPDAGTGVSYRYVVCMRQILILIRFVCPSPSCSGRVTRR